MIKAPHFLIIYATDDGQFQDYSEDPVASPPIDYGFTSFVPNDMQCGLLITPGQKVIMKRRGNPSKIMEWNTGGSNAGLKELGVDPKGFRYDFSCGAHAKSGKMAFYSGSYNADSKMLSLLENTAVPVQKRYNFQLGDP